MAHFSSHRGMDREPRGQEDSVTCCRDQVLPLDLLLGRCGCHLVSKTHGLRAETPPSGRTCSLRCL